MIIWCNDDDDDDLIYYYYAHAENYCEAAARRSILRGFVKYKIWTHSYPVDLGLSNLLFELLL